MALCLLEAEVKEDTGAMSTTIRMDGFGTFFATRERARQIWKEIDSRPLREDVILDWAGVNGVSGAFAHSLAARLLESPRRIGNTGMNQDVRETYELACRRWDAAQREARPHPG